MHEKKIRLTMPENMAVTVRNAVELLMRLKLDQPEQIIWAVFDLDDPKFSDKRDNAEQLLRQAFKVIFPDNEAHTHKWKDDEWYRLYNTWQVLEKALGIKKDKVFQFTDIPLPECEVIEE